MCNRFTVLERDEVEGIVRSLECGTPFNLHPDWPARHDAFPGNAATAIVGASANGAGHRLPAISSASLIWGFEAPWKRGVVFNTRIESALSGKGMWGDAIRDGRCVVPTIAFCEPHNTEVAFNPRSGRRVKQRYRFFSSNEEDPLMFLAAVRRQSRFSIVTTEPNAWVESIHDRMPLALLREEVGTWLGPDFARLADRGGIALRAEPELPVLPNLDSGEEGGQLSLF